MAQMIKVGMADLKVCRYPDNLTTIGLGSCIGIAMYDPSTKITGLAHIMLPDSTIMVGGITNIAKFADTAVPELLDKMIKEGANKSRIWAKIAGGAKMFSNATVSANAINVGERNAQASIDALKKAGIQIIAKDVGLNFGRTVEIYSENGEYLIKSVGKEPKTI